jgi:hypothetical protein
MAERFEIDWCGCPWTDRATVRDVAELVERGDAFYRGEPVRVLAAHGGGLTASGRQVIRLTLEHA